MAATKGMDAASYLKKQGWKGDGHSLDPSARGLKKPLLVSKKVDVLGVGLNKHAAVSDQWWMRAFDQGLKDLGTGKSNALTNIREHGMFAGGLYGRFVKGEGFAGTFAEDALPKRKREGAEDDIEDSAKKRKIDIQTEHEEAIRLKTCIDNQVDEFVAEAQKRGLLPGDDKTPKSGSTSPVASYGEAAVQQIFKQAGLSIETQDATASTKQQKYTREKQTRELKRAAKSFVAFQLSNAERKQIETYEALVKQERKAGRKTKEAAKATREAEKAAAREAKALRKGERRQQNPAAREENEDSAYGTDEAKERVSPARRAKYEARAAAKGIPLEQYIKDRESKRAAKESQDTTASSTPAPAFVVDLDGDAALAGGGKKTRSREQVVDSEGKIRYTVDPEIPVPLDPSLWDGINVKTLPKAVREARRQWMENERATRSTVKSGKSSRSEREKSKDEKKLEQVEKLLIKILVESRKSNGSGTATIDGIDAVPLVKVEGKSDGSFSKEEMSLARTVARRVLKKQKREAEPNEKRKSRKVKEKA